MHDQFRVGPERWGDPPVFVGHATPKVALSRIGYMSTDSTAGDEQPEMQGVAGATDDGRVYMVTPQGMAVEGRRVNRQRRMRSRNQ